MKQSKLIWAMFVKKMPKTIIEIGTGHSKHPIAVAYLPLEQIWTLESLGAKLFQFLLFEKTMCYSLKVNVDHE